MGFPAQHRTKLHSTNPLERLNKEVKRRADVVGIFPNEDSINTAVWCVALKRWRLRSQLLRNARGGPSMADGEFFW